MIATLSGAKLEEGDVSEEESSSEEDSEEDGDDGVTEASQAASN